MGFSHAAGVVMSESGRPATYFETAANFRAWLGANADSATECWVGFYKVRGAGAEDNLTWPQAVDEALAVGWIDGVRQSVDERRYRIRFTPRKAQSIWSRVNIDRFAVLKSGGRIHASGQAAYDAGSTRTGRYSHENEFQSLSEAHLAQFHAHAEAWEWFERQSPSYRKQAVWVIVSAKRAETRQRRLDILIAASAQQKRLR